MGNSGSSVPSTLVVQGHVLRIKGPMGEQLTASKGSTGGGSLLGGGGPSVVVYMAEDDARRKFAVQVTKVPVEDARGNAQAAKELAEHARLPPHPHLLAFVASKVESEGAHTLYYLVTEHCPRTVKGLMDGAAKRKEPLHEREILNIFTSAASAVAQLHAHGVAHRDVRVETLFFGAVDGHVKLGALGSCSTEHRRIRGGTEAGAAREEVERATTPPCRAPEQVDLFSGKVVGERVDVWALGVLLYQLCWWRTPFEDPGSPQGISTMAILSARYKAPLVAGGLPPYSPGVLVLLKELLEPDPDRRPTAPQVLLRVRELMREGEIGFFTDLPALGGGGRHSDASAAAGGLGAGGEHEEDLLGIHSLPAVPLASAVIPTTQQPSPMSVAHEPLALSLSLSSVSASRSAKGGGAAGGLGKGKQPMPPPIVITPGKGHHEGKGSGGVIDLSASVSASLAGAGSSGGYKENGGKGGMGRRSLSFARLAALGSGNGAAGAGAEGEGGGEDWRDDRGLDWTMGAGDLAVSAAASTRRRGSSGGSVAPAGGRGGGGVDLSELATVNLALPRLPRSSSASSLSALYDEHGRVRSASKTAVGALWQRRLSSFMGGGGGSGEKGKRSWVVKATSREPGQPKAKYVRKIVLAVWERQMSSSTFFIHLYQRPVLSHPVVALKGLITTLKLLQQGPRGFLAECAPCVGLLDEMGRHWGAVLGKVATDPTREQLTRSSTAEGYTSVVPHLVPIVGAGANGHVQGGCLGASGSSAAAISATAAANAAAAAVSASPSHKRQHLDAASMDLLARLARLLVAKLSFHEQHPAFATHFTAIPTMLGYETVPVAGGDSTEDLKALSRLLTLQDAILHTGRLAFAAKNEGVAATARWLLLPLIEEGYTVLVACTFLLASLLERSARAAAGLPLPATAAAAVPPGTPATPSRRASTTSASGYGASSSTGLAEWRQRVTALLALREQYEGQLAQLRALYADGERVEEVRAMKRVPLLPLSVPVALDGALNWKPATMRSPMRGVFGLGLDRARMEEEQGAVEGEEEETPRTAVTSTVALSFSGMGGVGMPITAHALGERRLDNGDLPLSSSSGHGRSSLAFTPVPAPPLSCHSSSSSSAPPPRVPPLLSVQNPAASAAVAALSSMATWESFADTAGLSNPGEARAISGTGAAPAGSKEQQRSGTQRRGSSLGVLASSGAKPAVPAAPSAATALLASTQRQQQHLALASSVGDEQARLGAADSTGGGWFLPSSVQAAVASTLGSSNGEQPLLASSAAAEPIGAAAAAAAAAAPAPAPATPGRAARAGAQSGTVEGFLQTTAQLDGTLVLPVVSHPHHSHHHHHHHHPAPVLLPPRMSIAGVPVGGAEGQAMLAKADSRDLLEWSSSSSEEEDEDDLTGTTGTVAALNTENMSRIIGVGAGVGGSAVIMGGLQTVDGVGPEAGQQQQQQQQQGEGEGEGEGESKRAPEDQQQQQPPPPPSQPPPAAAVDPAQQQAAVAAQEKQSRARRREARAQPWRAHMKPAVALALSGLLRELEAHAASLVPTDDIVWGETIGHGAFATVYRAYCRGQDVAVKKLVTQNNLPMVEKSVRDFASEVSLLRMLRHPNVIAFVGACADPVAVLTEYCHKGNLFMVLNEKARDRDISWARKLSVARGLADGMHYLHTREPILIHRDLKSLNVLLTRDWVVKITDFGLSRFKPHSLSDIMTMQCGTYHWMAPEVINSTKYTERADVYSFGIILWEIYTRAIPYDGMQPVQVVAAVINRGERPPLSADCPQAYAELVRACWAHEPAERPSFSEIVERLRALPE